MKSLFRRAAVPCLAVALLGSGASAQQTARAPERAADLIAIDFFAVSNDGTPVTDLRADEVSLRIGGRRRTVRSLQFIEAIGAPANDLIDLPSAFATNAEGTMGRRFSLIIDDDSFRAGREAPLRDAVDAFVAQLADADRISLVTMPYGGIKVPFTTDHARVRTAVSRLVGQATGTETGSEVACRTGRTLESLIGYLDSQGIGDEPLTVMFITGGLAAPRRDAPVMMAPGRCELRAEVFQQVGEAAGAARANFYVIQPGDTVFKGELRTENIAGVGFTGSDNPIEGIEHLTGVTRGKMLNLTGTDEGALGRVLRESAGYYRLSFDADRSDRSGNSQELEIKSSRSSIDVRARSQVSFAKPDTVGPRTTNFSAREMIAVPTVFRDLPLRASAYTALEPGAKGLRVITITEPVDPAVRIESLVAALFDKDGNLASHWTATPDELQRATVVGAMPAEPGVYRLRVAAIDTTGRAGTVDYEFLAEPVQTGSLRLSSVILGLSREGGFRPMLRYTTEPVGIAYLEMEGAPPGTRISTALELAKTLNGPPLAAVPLVIEPAPSGRYIARGAVPLGTLPPGEYVVRVLVGIEGHPLTRVVRSLRKDPK